MNFSSPRLPSRAFFSHPSNKTAKIRFLQALRNGGRLKKGNFVKRDTSTGDGQVKEDEEKAKRNLRCRK